MSGIVRLRTTPAGSVDGAAVVAAGSSPIAPSSSPYAAAALAGRPSAHPAVSAVALPRPIRRITSRRLSGGMHASHMKAFRPHDHPRTTRPYEGRTVDGKAGGR